MKSKPVEVHDRLFLSPDGNTLTAICAVLKGGGVAFMSVLKATARPSIHPRGTAAAADAGAG